MNEGLQPSHFEAPIILLAGRFDIPTDAHIGIVRALRDHLDANLVVCWVRDATQSAVHARPPSVSLYHRMQMLDIALQGEERIIVSDMSFLTRGHGCKADVPSVFGIAKAAHAFWFAHTLVYAMGADRLAHLHLDPEGLDFLERFPVLVVPRPHWNRKAETSPAGLFLREQACRQSHGGNSSLFFWQAVEEREDSTRAALDLLRSGQRPAFVRADVAAYAEAHRVFL